MKIKVKKSKPEKLDPSKISKGDEFELIVAGGKREHIQISQVFPPVDRKGPLSDQWAFYFLYLDRDPPKKMYGYMCEHDFMKVASAW